MANFAVIPDDDYKAFFNVDLITMFRIKKKEDGTLPTSGEVEVEFIGGSRKRLLGDTAHHFITGMGKVIN